MFPGILDASMLKRAQEKKLLDVATINLRDFASDTYKSVDDHPYGGGVGMVMRVDIVDKAITFTKKQLGGNAHVILLDPQGIPYTQKKALKIAQYNNIILVCGHYEGVDERIRHIVDEEISIGDYVLTGGEIPALVIVDSVTRLIQGVLKHATATHDESFTENTLEYPQYTRPKVYKNQKVPEILLSGDHKKIQTWRQNQAKTVTLSKRPDMIMVKKDSF